MEWLKNRSLKQSFFLISSLFLCVGLLLSAVSFMACVELRSKVESYTQYEISVNENGGITSSYHNGTAEENNRNTNYLLFDILQFALPVFFVVVSLVLADITFYRIKLKKPLVILQNSAERIRKQDLDFTVEKLSNDELGELCSAFETMRIELKSNNQELWRQMEERKRLNAAFSHDLRNPVTVLKGCAKLLQKNCVAEKADSFNIKESLSLITQYTARIETYVEAMSTAQKLEDWNYAPQVTRWSVLLKELEQSISFLGNYEKAEIKFTSSGDDTEVSVDKSIIQNVTENLVSNALRYAKTTIQINLSYDTEKLTVCVLDDGTGFSPVLLRKGIRPFLRDDNRDEQEHFGMGLYVCSLLCKKHGGNLKIENTPNGAKVTARFLILQS
ncbi:two-component sensor histidine kinase [Anaerocolumna cellulosilytica]|uniref:histidine kinase n=1 Tax=Anaerocolumna cellulosilytica TaxID=433286 RepID=A0A6S6RCR0_9FIRM|nr:HAMP domain-containing sensor histidine kinase [Anaerocolumna cellulosilytica]MBB5197496.1 K+-sensing histidine kinase KdpD [Anaerocolumna cellulosilytica]BCJ96521.1 two-component sensor histidine kinase [Anaerocolumna cellulosilytica]